VNTPTLVASFGAGLLSFLSPCTLPLVPGYLAFMSGLGVEEAQARDNTGTVFTAALLFVLGFSLVFVALGATASYLGSLVHQYHPVLVRAAGVFIILMALVIIGLVQVPALYRERRFHLGRAFGRWSAFPLGMAFAFGWVPCIGPILGAVLGVASTQGTAQQGAALLLAYALGLGVPFLAVALFADRLIHALAPIRRHYGAVNLVGGTVLLVMGIFLVLGTWTQLLSPLINWYGGLNLPT